MPVSKAGCSTYYACNQSKNLEHDVMYKILTGQAIPSLRIIERYKISDDDLRKCLANLRTPVVTKNRVSRLNVVERILGMELTVYHDTKQPKESDREFRLKTLIESRRV